MLDYPQKPRATRNTKGYIFEQNPMLKTQSKSEQMRPKSIF